MSETASRIIVAGAGPAGMAAALALSRAGRPVLLAGPPATLDDRRTTALMRPALDFLAGLGVSGELSRQAAPLRAMRIVDASSRLVRSPTVTFHAAEIGEEAFGLNIPNAWLNATLEEAVAGEPLVERRPVGVAGWDFSADRATARLADGETVAAALAVAADGRGSGAREAAGIGTMVRSLPQSALVLTFAHARDHGFTSNELHTENGPFTQVPLPGRRSSLVWVSEPREAGRLAGLDDDALSLAVERRMQSMLGKVTVEPGRQVHPLSSVLPRRFSGQRVALVGEAAHVFPPIGAQGLNLGLRDVADLAACLAGHEDPGARAAMDAYDRARRPDILARSTAVGLLNRSLLSGLLPAQLARGAGLGLLGAFAPLRAFFMREGMRPGNGFANLAASRK